MNKKFSWNDFESMSKLLESIGYAVLVFGPLTGAALLIFGPVSLKILGVLTIIASMLIALYHFSFALLMNGIRESLNQFLSSGAIDNIENETASSEK